MCGIAGVYYTDCLSSLSTASIITTITRMTATLALRGPDASKVFLEHPIAFGHRRLSILDLTEAGIQPMQLGADRPIITYNGEVFDV